MQGDERIKTESQLSAAAVYAQSRQDEVVRRMRAKSGADLQAKLLEKEAEKEAAVKQAEERAAAKAAAELEGAAKAIADEERERLQVRLLLKVCY